jgi:hypothetical protein
MQHSRAPGPLPELRAPVICTGFPPPLLLLIRAISAARPSENRKKGSVREHEAGTVDSSPEGC